MPRLGLGVYMMNPREAYMATCEALRLGYRLVDTVSMYGNEAAVGCALRDSGVSREEAFVVSKVNNPDHGFQETLCAVQASLSQLGLAYVDLMFDPQPHRWEAFRDLGCLGGGAT